VTQAIQFLQANLAIGDLAPNFPVFFALRCVVVVVVVVKLLGVRRRRVKSLE